MVSYSTLDIFCIVFCAIVGIACLLYLRFAPTYIRDRSKRYIKPRKRKGKFMR